MLIMSCDPGLGGALAVVSEEGIVDCVDMPVLTTKAKREIDEVELARLIDAWVGKDVQTAVLEKVGVRPGEGSVGAFTFGRGYGLIRGMLRAHFVRIVDITPQQWKAKAGIKAGAGKDASRALAKELFQKQAGLFSRVRDDGRAEAVIMGWLAIKGKLT